VIADPSQPVIVVSGLPRSGTSMMMQMLAAGGLPVMTDQVRTADDDNLEGYYELEAVKQTQQETGWLREAPGKAVKVIYRLLEYLPKDYRYHVLFMKRPLDEVLASQQVMLQRRGTQGATVSTDQLRTIFGNELERVISWLSRQPNFECLEIDYTQVLENPRPESERVSRFLAQPLDTAAMAARVNRQLHRQRR
jgi:hypothetical protein